MKPIDRLYHFLRQRAQEGLPMLQDREIAKLLSVRSGKRIEHGIRRLKAYRMIEVELDGNTARRRVCVRNCCTGWSDPPPAPRAPPPKPVVVVPAARSQSFHELMAGRKYDDIRLKNAP